MTENPVLHDYHENAWGRAIYVQNILDEGRVLFVHGISRSVKNDQHVLLADGHTYQVTEQVMWGNPKDAWEAILIRVQEPASDPEDFPLGKACDLSGEGGCDSCQ